MRERERERGGGQWAINYTSPQKFITIFIFVRLTTLGTLVNFN